MLTSADAPGRAATTGARMIGLRHAGSRVSRGPGAASVFIRTVNAFVQDAQVPLAAGQSPSRGTSVSRCPCS